MKPIALLHPYLQPPGGIQRVPIIGQISWGVMAGGGAAFLVGARLGSAMLGSFGGIVGALLGPLLMLVLLRAKVADQPLLPVGSGIVRFYITRLLTPAALQIDLRVIVPSRVSDDESLMVLDGDRHNVVVRMRRGTRR